MLRQNRLTHDYRDLWIWIKTHTEKNQTIYYCIPLRRICCCIQLKQNRIVHNMYTVEKDSCHWHGYSSSTIYLHKTQLQVCFSTNFGQGIFVIKCENWTILKQCNWLGAKTAQRNVFFQFFFSARIQNEQVIELRTGYIHCFPIQHEKPVSGLKDSIFHWGPDPESALMQGHSRTTLQRWFSLSLQHVLNLFGSSFITQMFCRVPIHGERPILNFFARFERNKEKHTYSNVLAVSHE